MLRYGCAPCRAGFGGVPAGPCAGKAANWDKKQTRPGVLFMIILNLQERRMQYDLRKGNGRSGPVRQ